MNPKHGARYFIHLTNLYIGRLLYWIILHYTYMVNFLENALEKIVACTKYQCNNIAQFTLAIGDPVLTFPHALPLVVVHGPVSHGHKHTYCIVFKVNTTTHFMFHHYDVTIATKTLIGWLFHTWTPTPPLLLTSIWLAFALLAWSRVGMMRNRIRWKNITKRIWYN